MKTTFTAALFAMTASAALAAGHGMAPAVSAEDQDVSGGTVTAASVIAPENGWLVVARHCR